MTRRIRIKLTSASWEPSGWRWRAADAQEPKGFISTALVPHGAAVDDVLTVELSSQWEGSEVLRVISPDRTSAADSATATDRPRPSRKKKQRKSRSSTRAANVTALAKVRELAWKGRIEEAIALCEERGWDPGKTDPRLRNKEANQKPVSTRETEASGREVVQPTVAPRSSAEEVSSSPKSESGLTRASSSDHIKAAQGIVWGSKARDPFSFFSASIAADAVRIDLNPEHPAYEVLSAISDTNDAAGSELTPEVLLKLILEAWATMETDSAGSEFARQSGQFRIELGLRMHEALEARR